MPQEKRVLAMGSRTHRGPPALTDLQDLVGVDAVAPRPHSWSRARSVTYSTSQPYALSSRPSVTA